MTAISYIRHREGGFHAQTKELAFGDPGHGSRGSAVRNSVVAHRHIDADAEAREERSTPSPQDPREMAPRWSWSAAEGDRRGAKQGGHDLDRDDQDPAQATTPFGCREGRVMPKIDEPWVQLATRIPKELHRRLKLHCVVHDTVLMHFVVEAIQEKLGRKPKSKSQAT